MKVTTKLNPISSDLLDEIARIIYIRTKDRMTESWGRVKETWDSALESSFKDVKNDELARLYAFMNSLREWNNEEIYFEVYCKETKEEKRKRIEGNKL